jgi:hypothetical protein
MTITSESGVLLGDERMLIFGELQITMGQYEHRAIHAA